MSNHISAEIVSNRLKLFMKKISATGREMAGKGKITEQAYSGYIKGKNLPAAVVLAEWAKSVDMNINWLLTGEGAMLIGDKTASDLAAHAREMRERIEELKYTIELQKHLIKKNSNEL